MAASSSLFGYRNAGARLECIGAPFLLTARSASLAENFRSAGAVPFAIFVAARIDSRLLRPSAALLWRPGFAGCFLFPRGDIFCPIARLNCITFLRSIDIYQRKNSTVDFVIGCSIWPDSQRVLATFLIGHFAVARA